MPEVEWTDPAWQQRTRFSVEEIADVMASICAVSAHRPVSLAEVGDAAKVLGLMRFPVTADEAAEVCNVLRTRLCTERGADAAAMNAGRIRHGDEITAYDCQLPAAGAETVSMIIPSCRHLLLQRKAQREAKGGAV